MRVVLDTNVLVSGIFFGGPPGTILDEWAGARFELLVTPSIFDEYLRTCDRLSAQRPALEYRSLLATIGGHGILLPDSTDTEPITPDPDDDKFIRCAQEHRGMVVSGDKHLLGLSGWNDVQVLKPRAFLTYLADSGLKGK